MKRRRVSEGASRGPRGGCRPRVMPHPRPSSPALAGPVGGGVYSPCRQLARVRRLALLTQAPRRRVGLGGARGGSGYWRNGWRGAAPAPPPARLTYATQVLGIHLNTPAPQVYASHLTHALSQQPRRSVLPRRAAHTGAARHSSARASRGGQRPRVAGLGAASHTPYLSSGYTVTE